nr:transposase [Roseomonas aerilata]
MNLKPVLGEIQPSRGNLHLDISLQWRWTTAAPYNMLPSGAGAVHPINGKRRDELLNAEVFNTLAEAKVLIEGWRRHYNTVRPHSSLHYRPLAPEVFLPSATPFPRRPSAHQLRTGRSHAQLRIRLVPLVGVGQAEDGPRENCTFTD